MSKTRTESKSAVQTSTANISATVSAQTNTKKRKTPSSKASSKTAATKSQAVSAAPSAQLPTSTSTLSGTSTSTATLSKDMAHLRTLMLQAYAANHMDQYTFAAIISFAQQKNIALKTVRFNIPTSVANINFNQLTLLHLLVRLGQTNLVREVVDHTNPYVHIPRNITHPSTNHLAHFAGLFAKCNDGISSEDNLDNFSKPLNKNYIDILDILWDTSKPDCIAPNLLHQDGGTVGHSAAIAGALDLLIHIYNKWAALYQRDLFQVPRNDGKTVLDFAKAQNHQHITNFYLLFSAQSKPAPMSSQQTTMTPPPSKPPATPTQSATNMFFTPEGSAQALNYQPSFLAAQTTSSSTSSTSSFAADDDLYSFFDLDGDDTSNVIDITTSPLP